VIKKLFRWLNKKGKPKIIPRAKHGISRSNIDQNALKVLKRLHKAGYASYLVGGGVRDCLLGLQPKDFDIATNAEPEQIRRLFSNCRLIGRRFRLAHIHFGREIIEVATFRAHHLTQGTQNAHGMIVRDNVYGSMEEDVLRRDFTVNSLYYNIANLSIVDYVGAMSDIKKRKLVLIGDPNLRYREDPVRMLRAVRFACKLDFTIDPLTAKPIFQLGNLLANIPPARIFEEFNKLFLYGKALKTYQMLCEYGLFTHIFPLLTNYTEDNLFIEAALQNTDDRVAAGKPVSPAFLIAVFYWQPLLEQISHFRDLPDAMDKLLRQQQRIMAVPRRLLSMVRDVWSFQWRLQRRKSLKGAMQILESPKFRAGYDFLLLRAKVSEDQEVQDLAEWWTKFAKASDKTRDKMIKELRSSKNTKSKS